MGHERAGKRRSEGSLAAAESFEAFLAIAVLFVGTSQLPRLAIPATEKPAPEFADIVERAHRTAVVGNGRFEGTGNRRIRRDCFGVDTKLFVELLLAGLK